jgi:hypothetical protein
MPSQIVPPLRLGIVDCGYQGSCMAKAAAQTSPAPTVCRSGKLSAAGGPGAIRRPGGPGDLDQRGSYWSVTKDWGHFAERSANYLRLAVSGGGVPVSHQ